MQRLGALILGAGMFGGKKGGGPPIGSAATKGGSAWGSAIYSPKRGPFKGYMRENRKSNYMKFKRR